MKYFLLLIVLLSLKINAQNELVYDKKFIDSEDKWVAFQKDDENKYAFGFIYIDSEAGLTLNHEGSFIISDKGTYISQKIDSAFIKVRLENNQVKVAWIPENKFQDLKVSQTPEWLKYYKSDIDSPKRLLKWGYLYNSWGKCSNALTYLEKAYNIDSKYKDLGVELAYSYNCLGEYEKAISIMKNVVKRNPNDSYSNKELIYAQIKFGELKEASKSVKKAIKNTDGKYNGENLYNLLFSYFEINDLENTLKWIEHARKWNVNNEQILNSINLIEQKINEKR